MLGVASASSGIRKVWLLTRPVGGDRGYTAISLISNDRAARSILSSASVLRFFSVSVRAKSPWAFGSSLYLVLKARRDRVQSVKESAQARQSVSCFLFVFPPRLPTPPAAAAIVIVARRTDCDLR